MASPQDNARFTVAVDDFAGVWPVIREAVQSRLPLKQLLLRNKFGNTVSVLQLNLQYLLSSSERVQRLKPYTSSPVTWFRSPFVQLCLISGEDVDDFKRLVKQQIRPLLDRDRDALSGEWVFAYLRPLGSDPASKGARKVFEAMRSEFNTRKRDRCVRMEALGPRGVITGLEELERLVKEGIQSTFEARAKAYDHEVRKLMAGRQEQGWKFATLFLVKDSLGVMLEAAGLLEDALREYFELEACFLEALSEGGVLAGHAFGGLSMGEDNAALLHAGWGQTRTNVHGAGLDAFRFRQYLFACQARLLMQLQRPIEVAERGLKFVQSFASLLTRRAELPQLFKEAWAFSACLALAGMATRMAPPPPTPNAAAPGGAGGTPIGLASSWRLHRRSTSEFVQRVSGNGSVGDLGATGPLQVPRSLSANDLHDQGSSRDDSMTASLPGSSQSSSPMRRMQEMSESEASEAEDARMADKQQSLARIRTKARGPIAAVAERALEGSHSPLRPASARAQDGGPRRPFERRYSRKEERERDLDRDSPPAKPLPPPPPEVDWDLGLPAELDGDWAEAEWGASGLPETGPPDTGGEPLGQSGRLFYCLLGHLYAAARQELVHMASQMEVAASLPPSSPSHNPGAAPLNFPPASMVPMNSISDLNMPAPASAPASSSNTPHESPDRHIGIQPHPSAEVALPPPPVVTGNMARFASQFGSTLHKRSDSATSLVSTPQDQQHTTLANAPPGYFGAGPGRRPSRGESIGAESDFGDASSVASEPDCTWSERPRGVLPPRIPGHAPATRMSAPALIGMSDADLAAVEQRVGTINLNGAAEGPDPTAQPEGSPLANGSTEPLFIPGDKKTGPQVKLPFGSAAVPPWLTHWRLKLALSSASQYQELWVELGLAAAACYGAAGRTRNAALLRAEVGEALAGAGAPGPAAQALARQAGMFLDQRWPRLSANLLPRLASCHRSLAQVTPPAICLQILSLPPNVHPFLNRVTVQAELMKAALSPPPNGGAISHMHNAPLVLNSQASMPIMLGSLMRYNSVASFRSQKSPEAGETSGVVDALSAVWAQPVRGTYSRFFGQSSLAEEPILAPAYGALLGHDGAVDASVGDIITVPVDVYSRLPMELPAHTAVLVLCVLQEMKLVFSPRTAAAIEQDPSLAVGPSHLRTSVAGTPVQQADRGFEQGTPARGGDSMLATDDFEGTSSRFGTRWQETEDVTCTLLGVSHDVHATTLDARPSVSPRAASEDRELHPQLQRVLSGSFAGPGPKSLHQAESLLRPPRSAFRTSSDDSASTVMLLPGYNRLFFQARPLKRGLYSLHHVALHIGKLQLILSPHAPPWDPAQPPKPPPVPLVERKGGSTPKAPPLGHIDPSGWLKEAAILLNVQSCRPRLAIAAVAQQGSLIAGQAQWLGLLVQPMHDRLGALSLHFSCEQAPSGRGSGTGEWGSPGSGSVGPMGSPQGKWRGQHGGMLVGLEAPEGSKACCIPLADGASGDEAAGSASAARVEEDPAYGPGWSTVRGLPQPASGTLAHPALLLIWLHVLAGHAPTQRETVRVQPPGPPPLSTAGRQQSVMPAEGGGLILSPRTQRHPHANPSAASRPPCLSHMDVSAEYTAGCSRAHAARLSIPVTTPFRMHVTAREVMEGRVSLQARVTSQLPWPATLHSATLALQSGFALECDLAQAAHLLPCMVMPGATVALSSLVRAHSTTPTAQGSHCSLSLSYTLLQQQQQDADTTQPDSAARVQQVAVEWGRPPLELGAASLPQPPAPSWDASSSRERGEDGSSSGRMQHQFLLEMASMSGPPQTSVHVHLLGPFNARAGQPVTLCWRLERCRHGALPLHTQLLQYEVLLKGEGWHGADVLRGSVPLPADPQATATVEATAVPEIAGSLTVPQLSLRDVAYEEIFEAGHSNDYIIVQP